jgi:multiple sugar transport system permease protein
MNASFRRRMLPYVLLSPLVVFIGALSFVPTAVTTVQAFFRVMPLDPPTQFIGLGNFKALFTNPVILTSWVNTAGYVAIGVVLSVVFGTAIAVALRDRFRFRGIVLAIIVLPWALPAVVEAVIWSWIYNPTFGVLNSALHSAHAIGGYHVWLGLNRWLTILLIEIVQVWQITPLAVLIILAALQSIQPDLYEAARVDGAGSLQMFRRISLPLIRPALAIATVEALVLSLNIFDQVYILNGIAPLGSSIMLQTYATTFQDLNFGGGYALSLLITVVTAVLSMAALVLIYRRAEAA